MTRRTLARAALAIAAVTVVARVVGFLRIAVFARTVGTTPLGDTYQTANTLPNILFEIVAGGALAAAVVPVVASSEDREHTRAVVSGLLTWTVVLLLPVALLGMVLGRPLTSLLVGGTADPALRAAKVETGSRMLLVFMPQVVLYGIGVVLAGALQARRRFVGPAVAPLLSSLVVIGVYVTYRAVAVSPGSLERLTRGEELLLALGTTAGVAVLSLSLLVPLRRLGLSVRPSLALPPGVGARVRRLAAAAVAGVVAQQVALAVVLRLCNVEYGAVVVHQIALTLYLLPWAVLAVPIATSAFPALSEAASSGDSAAFASVTAGALRAVLLAMALAAAVLAAAAAPLSSLVAGTHPSLTPGAPMAALPRAVVAFAPGLVGYGVLALLTRALYARDRGRAVAVATVCGFGVAAGAAVAFVGVVSAEAFGLSSSTDRVAAVGAANSLGMTLAGVLLALAVRRDSRDALAGSLRVVAVAVPVAVVAAVAGSYASRLGPALAGAALAGLVTTGVYALGVARLPDARAALALLRRRAAT